MTKKEQLSAQTWERKTGKTIDYKWADLDGFFKFLEADEALKGHNERYKKYIDTLR